MQSEYKGVVHSVSLSGSPCFRHWWAAKLKRGLVGMTFNVPMHALAGMKVNAGNNILETVDDVWRDPLLRIYTHDNGQLSIFHLENVMEDVKEDVPYFNVSHWLQ